jgi:bacterioferritin
MKGDKKIITELNKNLKLELGAIAQYVTHAAMADGWGYTKLSQYIMGRAREEMGHADALIDRIIFLEGVPDVKELKGVNVGTTIEEMFANDHAGELIAIESYERSITVALDLKDTGTRELFEKHLKDEERHTDIIEANQSQQTQMGIGNYLTLQVD